MTEPSPALGSNDVSPFCAALKRKRPGRTPVWFMRQAGRSLPEYRAIRGTGSILEAVKDPALACEITLQPVQRHDVDAAILYSDIIVPVHAAGFGIEIVPGKGPITAHPFTGEDDLVRLTNFDAATDTDYVMDTIRLLKKELKVPLIGFAGGPFTVASYLIEGAPSRTFKKTKQLMYSHPELFDALLERITTMTIDFLSTQITSGVDAVQLFDSWVGALTPDEYSRFILRHVTRIFSNPRVASVSTIHFGVNSSDLLELFASTGATAIGLDSKTGISETSTRLGSQVVLQGNLDPTICLSDIETIRTHAKATLADSAPVPGYIFNLGHGVLPETDPTMLTELVSFIHEYGLSIRDAELEELSIRNSN